MSTSPAIDLTQFVRDVRDFPKPGIVFKDITPLLANPVAFEAAIDQMADAFRDQDIDVIATAEARGFLLAAPLALKLNKGLVPIRKPGKLPYDTHSHSYDLEYGSDTLEMHVDGIQPGQKVLVVDDLLATGGTIGACCEMIEKCDAKIAACAFLINLTFLPGAEKLSRYPLFSVIEY
jgi:adenine phosphoribosyltransferase